VTNHGSWAESGQLGDGTQKDGNENAGTKNLQGIRFLLLVPGPTVFKLLNTDFVSQFPRSRNFLLAKP